MIARAVVIVAALQVATVFAFAADKLQLAPFKDELFRYQKVISSTYGGDYQMVEYSKERDLYGRDEVVEKRAFPKYVSLGVDKEQRDLSLPFAGRSIKYVGVGKTSGGAKLIVVFVHGLDGNRHQAVDDWTFGGNFNRLKNLVVANGGVYLSPDFSNFGAKGAAEITALIGEVQPQLARCAGRGRVHVERRQALLPAHRQSEAGRHAEGHCVARHRERGDVLRVRRVQGPVEARSDLHRARAGRQGHPVGESGGLLQEGEGGHTGLSDQDDSVRRRRTRDADADDRLADDVELDAGTIAKSGRGIIDPWGPARTVHLGSD